MKFLVIGLGSMGKRRIRNLHALGHTDIAGFDVRDDRRAETIEKYKVLAFDTFGAALSEFRPDALIISTGPSLHMDYALSAVDKELHCFIEASVVDVNRIIKLSSLVKSSNLIVVPSCTMRYYPGPQKVKELILAGTIGKPLNFNYQTGQYLPDWHPWETIDEFYVSKRETGGCREIVPFELTWLNDIFGIPEALACVKDKVSDIEADIDDIYHCLLRYPQGVLANVTVEVISQPRVTRELRVLGSEGEIVFSADENCVRYIRTGNKNWGKTVFAEGTIETGYINPEEPYIQEMSDFINAIETSDSTAFPNSLDDDICVLEILNELDRISEKIA